jgi:chemotaxis protein methyltransferase CheR
MFQVSRKEVEGKTIYEIAQGAWHIPALKVFLEGVLPEKHRVENYEIKHQFPKIGAKTLLFSGRRLYHQSKGTQLILLAIQDVTGQQ